MMINVNDVAPEKRKEVEAELREFFGPCAKDLSVFIDIIVTGKFSEVVGRILTEKCGVKLPYNAKHSEVVAYGKTIPYKRDSELSFALVFDASVFGKWEEEQRLFRLLTFSHEKVHIEDEKILCDDIGIDAFLTEPMTAEDIFFRLAHDIWMEYNAERYSIEIFMSALKELHSDATVNFNWHQGYVGSYISLLKSLPDFLKDSTIEFMNWKMKIEQFWPKMYLRLRETLVLAAFTSAHSDVLSKTNEDLVNLGRNQCYSFFFDTWRFVETTLRKIYETERRYDKGLLTDIANELRAFFERCGATLSNLSEGVYVAVDTVKSFDLRI